MRAVSLSAMSAIVVGSAAAAALAWLARRRAAAQEPPSATFEEWIVAVVRWEAEAAREKAAQMKGAPPAASVPGERR